MKDIVSKRQYCYYLTLVLSINRNIMNMKTPINPITRKVDSKPKLLVIYSKTITSIDPKLKTKKNEVKNMHLLNKEAIFGLIML